MKRVALLLILLSPLTTHAEQYLYVLSAKAKLYAEPSFRAPVVTQIGKGEKTVELGKNTYWFHVRYRGLEGWVSRLAVSPNPPMKRPTLLARDDGALQEKARRRASVAATTAAVRGLREDGRTRVSQHGLPDYDALERIEALRVEAEEVEAFAAALQP